eukprot:483550_1
MYNDSYGNNAINNGDFRLKDPIEEDDDWSHFNNFEVKELDRNWICHPTNNHAVEGFLSEFEMTLYNYCIKAQKDQILHKSFKYNITDEELDALNDFKEQAKDTTNPKRILLLNVDKGSSKWPMYAEDYNNIMLITIPKLGFTEIFDFNPDDAINDINNIINKWTIKKEIKPKWAKAIKPRFPEKFYYRIPILYGLPKIYKPNFPTIFDIRIISSYCGSFWEKLDIFISSHIKPLWLNEIKKGFIYKDTKDLVIRLLNVNKNPSIRRKIINGLKNGKKLLLFSFDVEKLYPSITHEYGLQQLYLRFIEQEKLIFKHPSRDCILNLLDYSLKNGVAAFNGKCYRKARGCGMGRCWACFYADLSLVPYDRLLTCKNWVKSKCNFDLLEGGRFRDDLKGLGLGTKEDIYLLLEAFNKINSSIKWKLDIFEELDLQYLEILDLSIYINKLSIESISDPNYDIISVDIHAKDTDTHCTLHASSCHVPHNHRGNIITQATRVRSICDDKFSTERLNEYACFTIARGHCPLKVFKIFNAFKKKTKEEALKLYHPNKTSKNNYYKYKNAKTISFNVIEKDENNNKVKKLKEATAIPKLFWLVLKYHPLLPNIPKVLIDLVNKWFTPNAKLAIIYPP